MNTLRAAALLLLWSVAASAQTVTCPNGSSRDVPAVTPLSTCVDGSALDDFSRSFVTGWRNNDDVAFCACYYQGADVSRCQASRNYLRYLQSGPSPVAV